MSLFEKLKMQRATGGLGNLLQKYFYIQVRYDFYKPRKISKTQQ